MVNGDGGDGDGNGDGDGDSGGMEMADGRWDWGWGCECTLGEWTVNSKTAKAKSKTGKQTQLQRGPTIAIDKGQQPVPTCKMRVPVHVFPRSLNQPRLLTPPHTPRTKNQSQRARSRSDRACARRSYTRRVVFRVSDADRRVGPCPRVVSMFQIFQI